MGNRTHSDGGVAAVAILDRNPDGDGGISQRHDCRHKGDNRQLVKIGNLQAQHTSAHVSNTAQRTFKNNMLHLVKIGLYCKTEIPAPFRPGRQ